MTAALPGAIGSALQSFGGGTALDFAKMFSGKLSGMLGDVASKVGDSTFSKLIGDLQTKIGSEGFQSTIAKIVNTSTRTKEGDQLSADQISQALNRHVNDIAYNGFNNTLLSMASQVTQPLKQAKSSFSNEPQPQPPVSIPQTTSGTPIESAAPTIKVPPRYNG